MYDGLLLGVLTWISFVISFNHFPKSHKTNITYKFFLD
jgi:hypothetical protein